MDDATIESPSLWAEWEPLPFIPENVGIYAYEEIVHVASLKEEIASLEQRLTALRAEEEHRILENEQARKAAVQAGFELGIQEIRDHFSKQAHKRELRIHSEFSAVRASLIATANHVFGQLVEKHPDAFSEFIASNLLPPPEDCAKIRVTLPVDSNLKPVLHTALSKAGFQATFTSHSHDDIVIDHAFGRVLCSPRELLEEALLSRVSP